MDDWTRDAVSALARDLAATPVFPFDTDPPARFSPGRGEAGAGHVSPLGLNIHPTYGLWHAYRAALLFPVAFDLPDAQAGAHPCESLRGQALPFRLPGSALRRPADYDVDGLRRPS